MRRTLSGLMVALLVIGFAALPAAAQDLSAVPDKFRDVLEELLATRFPPVLHSVTIDPETPVAGEPSTVTVEIYNPADLTDDETMEVYFMFTENLGESWDYIELETDDDKEWYGELPAFDAGVEVTYAIRAVDTSTNVFTTVPYLVSKDYELSPSFLIDEDCVNAGTDCTDFLPRGFFMSMSTDDSPLDDEEDEVPAYGDYVNYRVGYDEENIYVDLTVEGEISAGTMQPAEVHLYGAAIVNADQAGDSTDISAILDSGGLMLYGPHLKQFESTGAVSDCFLGYNEGGEFAINKDIQCKAKANHLIFVVPRELMDNLGDNESGDYSFIAISGVVTNLDMENPDGDLLDYSHVTTANFSSEDHYFVVE